MILIVCPKCGLFLAFRLEADRRTAATCRSCRKPLDPGDLIRAGLPSGLIARLMEWGKRSSEILTDLGAGLDDPQFIKAWKNLRTETRTLLEAWRRFVETEADVVAEVFDRKPAEAWTDQAIAEWRRQSRRQRDLSWYEYLIGSRTGATSGVVPYPTGAGSDEDREAFRCGFNIAVEFNTDPTYSKPFGQELNELESKYGRPCST